MRFRVEHCWKSKTTLARLCWGDHVVPVMPWNSLAGLRWQWPSGEQYTLKFPEFRIGIAPEYRLACRLDWEIAGEVTHCFLAVHGRTRWRLDDATITEQALGCRAFELRTDGGRRLAWWQSYACRTKGVSQRLWSEGVWRNSLVSHDVPKVAGMILATLPIPRDTS